jgi:hypothetical protein
MLASGRAGTVIFAGFGANKVADLIRGDPPGGLLLFDSPDDDHLDALMRAADVAIQLRRNNSGESSGVVAQLLEHGTRVVCSDIGSFRDYAGLVTFVSGVTTAASVEAAVVEALAGGQPEEDRRRAYVASHRPQDFVAALGDFDPRTAVPSTPTCVSGVVEFNP